LRATTGRVRAPPLIEEASHGDAYVREVALDSHLDCLKLDCLKEGPVNSVSYGVAMTIEHVEMPILLEFGESNHLAVFLRDESPTLRHS
jgi:hypothetical protein